MGEKIASHSLVVKKVKCQSQGPESIQPHNRRFCSLAVNKIKPFLAHWKESASRKESCYLTWTHVGGNDREGFEVCLSALSTGTKFTLFFKVFSEEAMGGRQWK